MSGGTDICGALSQLHGSVGEWFNPSVLKTEGPTGPVSSNLTASAIMEHSSRGLGPRAFNPLTGVRIPYALPILHVFEIKHAVPIRESLIDTGEVGHSVSQNQARVAQLAEAPVLGTGGCRFKSDRGHQIWVVSSEVEQRLYTANVGGSIPSRPTTTAGLLRSGF